MNKNIKILRCNIIVNNYNNKSQMNIPQLVAKQNKTSNVFVVPQLMFFSVENPF